MRVHSGETGDKSKAVEGIEASTASSLQMPGICSREPLPLLEAAVQIDRYIRCVRTIE